MSGHPLQVPGDSGKKLLTVGNCATTFISIGKI